MRNNLYERGDHVKTLDGNGLVNDDQEKGQTTVYIESLHDDEIIVYDVDDVELITSIS